MPVRRNTRRAVSKDDPDSDLLPKRSESALGLKSGDGSLRTKGTKVPVKREKETTKTKEKSIYSFFNVAAQRQTASQSTLESGSPRVKVDDHEPILDISDGETSQDLSLSKDSAVVLNSRKRRFRETVQVSDRSLASAKTSQKFIKTGPSSFNSVQIKDQRPWVEQFPPIDLSELAVHKRKVSDVRQWLEAVYRGRKQKILVLKGAAGAGKTTTIKLLATELRAQILEWRNPSGNELTADDRPSASSEFEDFVARAGRIHGLTFASAAARPGTDVASVAADDSKRLILVEEFPNTYTRNSASLQSFRTTLLQYVAAPRVVDGWIAPIVLVISETLLSTDTSIADSFTAHRLLGPDLLLSPYVDTIEFNPVAPTILTKALDTIIIKEARISGRRRAPGPAVLKHLAESGDLRSATSSLEFLCSRNDSDELWSSKISFTKGKKASHDHSMTEAESEAIKIISNRETSLSIFHAVGRVVHNNRCAPPQGATLSQPPEWLRQHWRVNVPERSPDKFIDEVGTDIATFIAALHENYVPSCASENPETALTALEACIDDLSDADLLSMDHSSSASRNFAGSTLDSLRQSELSFQTAVRGLLFHLPSPVHRSVMYPGRKAEAFRMFYPASLRVWKKAEEIEGVLRALTCQYQERNLLAAGLARSTVGTGVENWKSRNSTLDSTNGTSELDKFQDDSPSVSTSRDEMLMERLPYIHCIMEARPRQKEQASVLKKISAVTCINGHGLGESDDTTGMEAEDDHDGVIEQWSTDKPDTDSAIPKHGPGFSSSRRPVTAANIALPVPVEDRVSSLILEDDDIVD